VENRKKIGVAAGLAAIGVFLAHMGDDIWRGARRIGSHTDEVPIPRPSSYAENGPFQAGPVAGNLAPLGRSALDPPVLISGGNQADQVRIVFRNAVADSAARLARDQRLNIQFEVASGKLKIGSSRQFRPGLTMGYREINVYNTAMMVGTPLALCWATAESSTERMLRNCVDRALIEMSGLQPTEASRKF